MTYGVLAIVFCLAGLPWSVTAQAAGTPVPVPDTAASLRQAAEELRPARFCFGPPAPAPTKKTASVSAVRARVLRYTQSHTGRALNLDWFIAVENSFALSLIMEWPEYSDAETALREWWLVLANAKSEDEYLVANLVVRLASAFLRNWTQAQPVEALRLMQEVETQYLSACSTSEQENWKWWVARCAEYIQRVAAKVAEPERTRLLAGADALLNRAAVDPTMPLHSRTFIVTKQARTLYGQGEPERAAALLDGWWRKHGALIRTPDFYGVRFFVASLGLGDRATAMRMVAAATRLAVEDAVFAKDGNYTGMMATYYTQLPLTDAEWRRNAYIFMTERKLTQTKVSPR